MLMFLVDEGRRVEVDVRSDMSLSDLHEAIERACVATDTARVVNHGALLLLDTQGRPVHEIGDEGLLHLETKEVPLFLFNVMAVLDPKQSHIHLNYNRGMDLPDVRLLTQQPQHVFPFVLELNNDRQHLLTTTQSLVQDIIFTEKGFHSAYKSITALNNALAEQCALLDQKSMPFLDEFKRIRPIVDKLKTLLVRLRVKPSYIGMEGDEFVSLLSLHEDVSTEEKFSSLVSKTETAAEKVEKLCQRYAHEVEESVRPYKNITVISKHRGKRKQCTNDLEKLFLQHKRQLNDVISMNVLPMASVLNALSQRHALIKERLNDLIAVKTSLCSSCSSVLGEVLSLEQSRKTFFERYDLKVHSHTVNYLSRGVRVLSQLLHLPYTFFQITTEIFRRTYIKTRHAKAMKTIRETVNNMRQSELDIRRAFVSEDLVSRVPSSWTRVFPLLSDYPHSCLRKPRPFDERLPDISAVELTASLDHTEAIVKELQIEDIVLDEKWRTLRAQDIALFEHEYLKTVQPLEKGVDKATQELNDDPEVFRLRHYAQRLEEEIVALNIEMHITKSLSRAHTTELSMRDCLAVFGQQRSSVPPTTPAITTPSRTRVGSPRKMSFSSADGHKNNSNMLSSSGQNHKGMSPLYSQLKTIEEGEKTAATAGDGDVNVLRTHAVMMGLQRKLKAEEKKQNRERKKEAHEKEEEKEIKEQSVDSDAVVDADESLTKEKGEGECVVEDTVLRGTLHLRRTAQNSAVKINSIAFNTVSSSDDNDDGNGNEDDEDDVDDFEDEDEADDIDFKHQLQQEQHTVAELREEINELKKQLKRKQMQKESVYVSDDRSLDKSFMRNVIMSESTLDGASGLKSSTANSALPMITFKQFNPNDIALFLPFNGGLGAFCEGTLLHLVPPEECVKLGVIPKISRKPKKNFAKAFRIVSLERKNTEEKNAFGLPTDTPYMECHVEKLK
eukprot:m.9604 g.9604  ORF g.9604 m.9604 type:complete len:954 (-) comp6381_c0_seq3:1022-3883(-)